MAVDVNSAGESFEAGVPKRDIRSTSNNFGGTKQLCRLSGWEAISDKCTARKQKRRRNHGRAELASGTEEVSLRAKTQFVSQSSRGSLKLGSSRSCLSLRKPHARVPKPDSSSFGNLLLSAPNQ